MNQQQQHNSESEREKELKAFDDTKAGVKGLVDAGISKVPQIFINSSSTNDDDPQYKTSQAFSIEFQIPVIDLKEDIGRSRKGIIEKVRVASEKFGFFQVVNHGIPKEVLDEVVEGARRFHEEPVDIKEVYYSREASRKVKFSSNFDLYQSKSANWRDSLFCLMAPESPKPEELPSSCRDITTLYSKHVKKLGLTLLGLISEALGLRPKYLEEMECCGGHVLIYHYYPACPEPNKTMGTTEHTDPDFITILLQDNNIGGLQVFYQNQWVDVKPMEDALVINIGDLTQLISNDKFKSAKHRVLANREGPRISVACFFNNYKIGGTSQVYGPIKELLSEDNPPFYKETTVRGYMACYNSTGLGIDTSALELFKL